MSLRRLAVKAAVLPFVIAACAGTGPAITPSLAPTHSPAPTPAPTPAAQRIVVTLSDQMRIEPAMMTVRSGEPVTFVVTNGGQIAHEFYLGDEAAQAALDQEMAVGGMAHDQESGIGLEPGETKELTYTFASPGQWLAGCHVPGHYASGMKAAITISD